MPIPSPPATGIKAFADRFGPLGRTVEKPIPLDDQRNAKGVPLGMGESLADWHHEILTMRLAIDIWEAVRRGDVDLLGQLILWNEDGSGVRIMSHPELTDRQLPDPPAYVERAWIASTHHGDDVLGRFVRGDLVKPALHYVQSTINQHLENRIGARLLWDTKRARLDLYTSPVDLIGAVWLQFARAVERDSKFRQCAECGTWFELAPGTARADKLYCSTPCRTKAYRKRQAEAARLHGEGRSTRGHRPRAGQRSRHRARLDRAQGSVGRIAQERDRIAERGRRGGRIRQFRHRRSRSLPCRRQRPGARPDDCRGALDRGRPDPGCRAAASPTPHARFVGEEGTGLLARPKRSCDRTAAEKVGR